MNVDKWVWCCHCVILGPECVMLLYNCTSWVLDRAPHTKETLSDFCQIMDPSNWDTTVWYPITRYPQASTDLWVINRALDFGASQMVSELVCNSNIKERIENFEGKFKEL